MARQVRTPDGIVHSFPDDATDDEIRLALSADAKVARPPASAKSSLASLATFLPAAGGTVGGIALGPAGAIVGGAAGEGYKQLAQHATELPGAIRDVSRNLLEQPLATLRGAMGGAQSGAQNAAVEGATQGAIELGGGLVGKYAVQPVARAVMRGYLKPSLAARSIKEAREIVQTALDEALPVTKGGEARAGRLINEINADINSTLAKVKGKIDLSQVADRVRAFAKLKYFKPGVSDADYQAALEVADAIDRHAALTLPSGAQVTKVNAPIGNEIKQAVRPPSRAYGAQGYAPETTTRKVAGSEMRQEIEHVAKAEGFTDVGAKNAREGRIIDAQEAIQRAAGREENKGLNPTAVPNLIAGMVGFGGGAYQKDPAAGLAEALAVRMALSPAVMTRAAILASRLAKNGYTAAGAARAAIAIVQSEGQQPENQPE